MPVRLLSGAFLLVDGKAMDNFELIAAGAITLVAPVAGTGGCNLLEGSFAPRL